MAELPKYYDASSKTFITVSQNFLNQLRNEIPSSAKIAAITWINASGSEKSARAVKEGLLEAEMLAAEKLSIESLRLESEAYLATFNLFRIAFVGKASSTELAAFLSASEFGMQDFLHYRDQLDYRNRLHSAWTTDAAARVAGASGLETQLKSFAALMAL